MKLIKNLFKAVTLTLAIVPALGGCTAFDDEYPAVSTDDTRLVKFDIPERNFCGGNGSSTRVAQEDTKATWEKGDVIYICATFLTMEENQFVNVRQFSAMKCEDPAIGYWKYLTPYEYDDLQANESIIIPCQLPLRWPILTTKGQFIITYAGSKLDDYGSSTGAKIEYSDQIPYPDGSIAYGGSPIARVGDNTLVGQVDVMRTSTAELKAGEDITLPPFKHLLTRLRVKGGGSIRATEGSGSRIAIATGVNLYTGMVNSVMETGTLLSPSIKDGRDYFVIASYKDYIGSSTGQTADGKIDYLDKPSRITVKLENSPDEYTLTLVRPTTTIGGVKTPTVYAGTAFELEQPLKP